MGINAHCKPQFEGQIVKFHSPITKSVILYDICKYNQYGQLAWYALNDPTSSQINQAMWEDNY